MNWNELRVELQHEITATLGGDWIVVYMVNTDMVILVNTRDAEAYHLLTAAMVDDHFHKTPAFRGRLLDFKER